MLNRFLQFIKKHALINNGEKLLLAVSGGLDSMVLLHLCKLAKFDVSVAHCNFQLRGEASETDADFVKRISLDLGCPYFEKSFETKSYARAQGVSTQMAARDLRYQWFNELLLEHQLNKLAVGHHLNDNFETVLLNLVRGTSIAGLRGMKPKAGHLIRPLLDFERDEIEHYAISEGILWREDSSNASEDYKRNFIRHQIMPRLSELNPGLLETFKRTTEKNLEVEGVFLDRMLMLSSLLKTEGDSVEIAKEDLKQNNVGAFQLSELLKPFGFNFEQSKEVLEAIEGISGKQFLSITHKLIIDRYALIISPVGQKPFEPLYITREQNSFELSGIEYKIQKSSDVKSLERNAATAELDSAKLIFPLVVRGFQEGDYFFPLGMKGKKKLSDFMIDEKIPLNLKKDVRVMLSGQEIVWIIGHRIDDRFKVTTETQELIRIKKNVQSI
ncbi:MAG: tRNA lysidine(34) synthetase TilS [Cytophagales bacterium CG12_big_fil_rev_8_21_14_0_65_40_12]|nr:MAG: tRNA lysidine(34) synthetase TilS [Cytophagales bacterium CG12_big_fil_rev_8_21_14_0_65_40_12]PIW05497.1 MAG: tRNA lysidine(34) synthetase TilS [Cytophagales bacterium CG17_big_fil_post_rev_8_21_14_2_50_40_13]